VPTVGRTRTKNLHCPAGVREIEGRWYWQPTSKRERDERKAQGLPVSVTLGDARSKAARQKWAEVSGFRDVEEEAGTVAELLTLWERDGIKIRPNGLPRAESTIKLYRDCIPFLKKKWGACRYGRTADAAAKGLAIGTVDIQDFIANHQAKGMANRYYAVMDNTFSFAISKGRTTYNPCADATKNAQQAREREPLPWEVECLRTLANTFYGLLMDFEAITGWRIGQILKLQRSALGPDGIRVTRHQRKGKTGKTELWEWTPELRRIVAEATKLPGATPFPASPVFPSRRGKPLSHSAFKTAWRNLRIRANKMLAPLVIEELHFHDLRSKAHDDAVEAGREGHEFLGNTEAVARKHYARREVRKRPLA
jgi:integrase